MDMYGYRTGIERNRKILDRRMLNHFRWAITRLAESSGKSIKSNKGRCEQRETKTDGVRPLSCIAVDDNQGSNYMA